VTTSLLSLRHYLTEPVHVLTIGALAVIAVVAVSVLARSKRVTSETRRHD
jgi:hypothetical protein